MKTNIVVRGLDGLIHALVRLRQFCAAAPMRLNRFWLQVKAYRHRKKFFSQAGPVRACSASEARRAALIGQLREDNDDVPDPELERFMAVRPVDVDPEAVKRTEATMNRFRPWLQSSVEST